ncbi:MAG: hypothetical protein OEN01_01820, partial [Candidatus Krumholzibacteria bacterium]|nr:hypothetical protein [Candidatus Krumholzibacteria bacterium]
DREKLVIERTSSRHSVHRVGLSRGKVSESVTWWLRLDLGDSFTVRVLDARGNLQAQRVAESRRLPTFRQR